MADLDFSSLSAGSDPALAPASAIRARGEQRRRRSHALVAGTAALVVALGAGTAVALVDRGKPDALVPATPTVSPTTASAVPSAARHLLTTDDAARVAGGTWQAEQVVDGPALLVIPCSTSNGLPGEGAHRTLRRGSDHLVTNVVVQADAERHVLGLQEQVLGCPRAAADSEDGKASNSFELVDPAPGASLAWPVTVVRDTYRDCDTCGSVVTLWVVVGQRDLMSFTALPPSEQPRLLAWAHAARDRLEQPVTAAPTPSPTPSRSAEPVVLGPLDEQDLVEPDRIGPVEIGMTLAEAEAAAEQDLRREGDVLGSCAYYGPATGQPDVSFMVIDGIVSRIDVHSGTTTTSTGIGIGATEAEVKRSHPDAVVSKHYYTDGHYLRVLSEDGRYALLFETDGRKVLNFRSGFPSAVDAPEGCA